MSKTKTGLWVTPFKIPWNATRIRTFLVHAIPKGHEGLEVRCIEYSFSHVATAHGNPKIGIPQSDLNRSGQEEVTASCRHQMGFS